MLEQHSQQNMGTEQAPQSVTLPDWCKQKALVTVAEACMILSCGRTHLYALIGKHEIVSVKMGNATRIPVNSLNKFLYRLEGN